MQNEEEEVKLDEFHWHEALDRTYCVQNMANELLYKHPVFEQDVDLRFRLDKVMEQLNELYFEIANRPDNESLKLKQKVYVRWNPLYERVVCAHSSDELECEHCIKEQESVKDTAYTLEGKWCEVDSDNNLCYCGNLVDVTNPDCVAFNLCKEHSIDA